MIALLLLAAIARSEWVLTVDGLGPVRIGMTRAQVARTLHAKLRGSAIESADLCVEQDAREYPGLTFMFEDRRLSRISIRKPSQVRTPRAVGAGATAAAVRRAYPTGLRAERNYYEDPPAEYLTYWTIRDKRGIRFETGLDRKVQLIHAGNESITYVEGCA